MHAPPGTLATLNGLAGGAHFGFGKGVGGLVGGLLKDNFGTFMAFRLFIVFLKNSYPCTLSLF